MSDEPTSLKAWHGALKCGETTDEGVPPESIGDIVTALLASMWLAGPSESDPASPPDDGVLKCAPLHRLGIDGCEEAQTASLTATSLALDSEGGAALALQLAEIGASRAAKDEDEAHGCASLDRAFTLTMVDGTKHVLEAASVEERREWLALLFEAPLLSREGSQAVVNVDDSWGQRLADQLGPGAVGAGRLSRETRHHHPHQQK